MVQTLLTVGSRESWLLPCEASARLQVHLGTLGLWLLILTWTEALMGQADDRPTGGLDPTCLEAHFWRQGLALGSIPCWAPDSGTLDPVQHGTWVLDCCVDAERSVAQIPTKSDAARRWQL